MRQFPSRQELQKIADAVQDWAKRLRMNWPLDGASAAENPALRITPKDANSNLNRKRVVRQILEVARTTALVRDLLADIEPADPLEGVPEVERLRRRYPREPATQGMIAGWPVDVSRAVEFLKQVLATVKASIENTTLPVHVRDVEGVEWAAGVLRGAAGGGKPTAQRRGGGRKRKSSVDIKLTGKQLEASQIVAECKGDIAEAARRLGKDRATVEQHYSAAMKKLGKTVVKHATTQLPSDRRGQVNIADGQDRR
jgi:predicted DNA-binding protein (UPF0251 family)